MTKMFANCQRCLFFYFSWTMKQLEAIKAITDIYICVIQG